MLEGVQTFGVGGTTYERFLLDVENHSEYPQALFDAAPNLPPCGTNANSSRTWVYIHNAAADSYVYSFCALGVPANLNAIWFARPRGPHPPPSTSCSRTGRPPRVPLQPRLDHAVRHRRRRSLCT